MASKSSHFSFSSFGSPCQAIPVALYFLSSLILNLNYYYHTNSGFHIYAVGGGDDDDDEL